MKQKNLTLQKAIISLGLCLGVLIVYFQVYTHDYVNYDDGLYVTQNEIVQRGLTLEGVRYAFTSFYASNWHPLTWLSHMLDCQLFGVNAGMHHAVNVAWHLLNTILLFLVLHYGTGAFYRSAFVAALFALHPMHVESVAWIAERKDLVSTFWGIITIWAYFKYCKKDQSKKYYWAALFFFALGLLTKPMVVTLPFVLILLDYWPLNRIPADPAGSFPKFPDLKTISRLCVEKIPFFCLTLVSCLVTFAAQKHGGSMVDFEIIPLHLRFINAIIAYVRYIWKLIAPYNLSLFYPYSKTIEIGLLMASIMTIVVISSSAVYFHKKNPSLLVGWLFFLGTLVPVIGLIQVGGQAMADRYSYLPYIGLFIMIAWAVPDLNSSSRKLSVIPITACILLGLIYFSYRQTAYWKNSITLFTHAVNVTSDNALAHSNLAAALNNAGRYEEAIVHYRKSLKIKPNFFIALKGLGFALYKTGRADDAIGYFQKALKANPNSIKVNLFLADAYKTAGLDDKALREYKRFIDLYPSHATSLMPADISYANGRLADLLFAKGQNDEALKHYGVMIQISPSSAEAYIKYGFVLYKQRRYLDSLTYFQKALKIDPGKIEAYLSLGKAFWSLNRLDESINSFKQALVRDPGLQSAKDALGKIKQVKSHLETMLQERKRMAADSPQNDTLQVEIGDIYAKLGNASKMLEHYQQALKINPASLSAVLKTAYHYAGQKDYDQAIEFFKKAIDIDPHKNTIYYNVGCLYALKADSQMSIKWLTLAVQNGYDNCENFKTDKDLKTVRKAAGFRELMQTCENR